MDKLLAHKMNAHEQKLVSELRTELIQICDSLEIPRGKKIDGSYYMGRLLDNSDYALLYKQETGYYEIAGERGVFSLNEGFPVFEKEDAKYIILKNQFLNSGMYFELENRKMLEEKWKAKYSVDYDSRKAIFEFLIHKLNTVFGMVHEATISEYTDHMNRWFESKYWYFSMETLSFEVISANGKT